MLTYLLLSMNRWARVLTLLLIGIFALPHLVFAVAYSDVVEMFRYSYGVDKMIYLASVETVLFNWLKRKKKKVGGRGQWIIPYKTKNGGVFVGMSEGATLTTRRAQPDTAEATFSLVEFQGVWDITWKMLRQASRSADAFETAMNFMDESIRTRIMRVINAQVCSFTGMGELAILPAADDTSPITVNSLPFVDPGMYLDIMDDSDKTTVLGSAVTATAVDIQGRTISTSANPVGTAAGDFFVPAGQITGGTSYSLLGLGAWLSNSNPPAVVGNIGGINRSTVGNEFYQGNVLSNSGTNRALTEDLIITGENLMRERGGVQPTDYFANGNIIARYHGECIKDRYFAYNKIQMVGANGEKVSLGRQGMDNDNSPDGTGETPYQISGKPLHQEPYLRANRMIGANKDHFWIGHDGIEMPMPVSEVFEDMISYFTHTGSAKYDVWSYWESQLLSDNPQAGIQFQDLAES